MQEILENVFNENMYLDCAQYSMLNKNATRTCSTFNSMGGVAALIALPTSLFVILHELLLLCAFVSSLKRSAKQHIYGAFQCFFGILFATSFGIIDMFISKGFAWLGYTPIFLEFTHVYSCKGMRLQRTFILATISNLMFVDAVNRATSIKAKCFQPITGTKSMLILVISVLGGFVAAIPTFLVGGIWRLDGRIFCGNDPNWSPVAVKWLIVHEVLVIDGFIQAIGVYIAAMGMSRDLGKLDNTIDYMHTSHRLPGEITDTINQVTFLIREVRRDAWISIQFTISMATLMLSRSILQACFYYNIYFDYEDNAKTKGALQFYYYISLNDLFLYLMLVVFGYHFWLFFYHVPAARSWIFGETTDRQNMLQRTMAKFLPVNPDSEEFGSSWDSSAFYYDKGDQSLFERLDKLETKISDAEYKVEARGESTVEEHVSKKKKKKDK